MKLIRLAIVSLSLLTSPALAMEITNLDSVPHTVELVGGGHRELRTIAPDATEYFTGAANGRLSLVVEAPETTPANTAKKGKKSNPAKVKKSIVETQGMLNADGVLSGIVGAARSTNIPVDPDNNYTIWPGGKIYLQSRRKRGGSVF